MQVKENIVVLSSVVAAIACRKSYCRWRRGRCCRWYELFNIGKYFGARNGSWLLFVTESTNLTLLQIKSTLSSRNYGAQVSKLRSLVCLSRFRRCSFTCYYIPKEACIVTSLQVILLLSGFPFLRRRWLKAMGRLDFLHEAPKAAPFTKQ